MTNWIASLTSCLTPLQQTKRQNVRCSIPLKRMDFRRAGTVAVQYFATHPTEERSVNGCERRLKRRAVGIQLFYLSPRGRICEEHGEGYDSGERGNENIYGMPADRPGYRQLHNDRAADNDSRAEGKCGTDAGGKAHHCFLLSASNGLLSRGPR